MGCNCGGTATIASAPTLSTLEQRDLARAALFARLDILTAQGADPCPGRRRFIVYPTSGAPEVFAEIDYPNRTAAIDAAFDRVTAIAGSTYLVDSC